MFEPLSSNYSEETQTALRQLQWYVASGRFEFITTFDHRCQLTLVFIY